MTNDNNDDESHEIFGVRGFDFTTEIVDAFNKSAKLSHKGSFFDSLDGDDASYIVAAPSTPVNDTLSPLEEQVEQSKKLIEAQQEKLVKKHTRKNTRNDDENYHPS